MKGRWETILVLLLVLLMTSLTGTVLSQSDDVDEDNEAQPSGHESTEGGDTVYSEPSGTVADDTSVPDSSPQEVSSSSPEPSATVSSATSTPDTFPHVTNPTSAEGSTEEENDSDINRSNIEESASLGNEPLSPTTSMPETEDLNPIIILIPVALVVLIIAMIVGGIVIHRKCIQKINNNDRTQEDSDLHGSSTEKVPMPMFEEDVPSVLELEMEELDQLMNKTG